MRGLTPGGVGGAEKVAGLRERGAGAENMEGERIFPAFLFSSHNLASASLSLHGPLGHLQVILLGLCFFLKSVLQFLQLLVKREDTSNTMHTC